jgi:hypothetical protein
MSGLDGVHGTVCDVRKYQQSLTSETSPNPTITCLTHGQTIGLTVSILLFCLVPKLRPHKANGRDILLEPSLCDGPIHLNWCRLEHLTCHRVYLV